jgi:hypothetical protein
MWTSGKPAPEWAIRAAEERARQRRAIVWAVFSALASIALFLAIQHGGTR